MASSISLVMPIAGTGAAARTVTVSDGNFFDLAEERMAWLDGRQKLLAQNIANANTPDYRAHDLKPFDRMLRGTSVLPIRTDPMHIAPATVSASLTVRQTGEQSPDGNTVSVEGQMVKVAEDETNATLADNLWKSTMGLFMAALGKAS